MTLFLPIVINKMQFYENYANTQKEIQWYIYAVRLRLTTALLLVLQAEEEVSLCHIVLQLNKADFSQRRIQSHAKEQRATVKHSWLHNRECTTYSSTCILFLGGKTEVSSRGRQDDEER